jgi:hypothetical protein
MRIDHVIYVTGDLDETAVRVQSDLNLTVLEGGRHEGHGTHNRIVPLGGGYLELMAIADPDEASSSPIGGAVQARLAEHGEGLFAWAVAVDDLDSIAERLESPVTAIEREGLSARLVGVGESLGNPGLPFFIERDEGVADPGAAGTAGGITWLEVAGAPDTLAEWLGGNELPVRDVDGPAGVRAMGIGSRELRNS